MNNILFVLLIYFLATLVGSLKAIYKIKSMVKNFLWNNTTSLIQSIMASSMYCKDCKDGGFCTINPKEATKALLFKWIINALSTGQAIIQ